MSTKQRAISRVIKSVDGLKLKEDKHADANEENPEETADERGVGAGKRQRAEEDSEASPPKKEKKKKGAR